MLYGNNVPTGILQAASNALQPYPKGKYKLPSVTLLLHPSIRSANERRHGGLECGIRLQHDEYRSL